MKTLGGPSCARPAVCVPGGIDDEVLDMIWESEDQEAAPWSRETNDADSLPREDLHAEPSFSLTPTPRQIATPCRGPATVAEHVLVTVRDDARAPASSDEQREAAPLCIRDGGCDPKQRLV